MIVCHCKVVSDRDVADALQEGQRTLAGVCRSTGAGSGCGVCVFSLKRLLCQHGNPLTLTPEVDVAAG